MLKCPICIENYQEFVHEPIILIGCGHTICRDCAQGLEKQSTISCPTCRGKTRSTAASLPKNFALCEALSTALPLPPICSTSITKLSKIDEATEMISKLSTEELIKVYKTIAEQEMKPIIEKIESDQEEFKQSVAQIEGMKAQVVQYIAEVNRNIKPINASMQAKRTSIQSNIRSLATICNEANAKIAPLLQQQLTNSHQQQQQSINLFHSSQHVHQPQQNTSQLVAPKVPLPVMPPTCFVAAPRFVDSAPLRVEF